MEKTDRQTDETIDGELGWIDTGGYYGDWDRRTNANSLVPVVVLASGGNIEGKFGWKWHLQWMNDKSTMISK